MEQTLRIIQIIFAVLLIAAVLTQQRSTALGEAFGGDSAVYRSRRGVEKYLFSLTIVLAVLFVGSIVAAIIIK